MVLAPGAKFEGYQKSGKHSYSVIVEIKSVDLAQSHFSGYLNIKGLTEEYPELTTFFESEIIGDRFSFLTNKWDVPELIDKAHWCQFEEAFAPHAAHMRQPNYKFDFRKQRFWFMRWKEHFLVPDHRITSINGASLAGFYYMCFDREQQAFQGFYYHHQIEKFQSVDLRYKLDPGSPAYEFR
eukprot:TRINITY_DN16128_c0_g1_i1.p1 TRINITY_DN16128_c0_g1~~TRINITY_DN16128_c0_g1_i1.p1  ORF type:complete len:182 (-),score=39.07 TRINITY_DN16128_c0_g1_i1:223-768(-)